jgi:hypothetical protein
MTKHIYVWYREGSATGHAAVKNPQGFRNRARGKALRLSV